MKFIAALLFIAVVVLILWAVITLAQNMAFKGVVKRRGKWVPVPHTDKVTGVQYIALERGPDETLEFWRQSPDEALDDDDFETALIRAEQRCEVLNRFAGYLPR